MQLRRLNPSSFSPLPSKTSSSKDSASEGVADLTRQTESMPRELEPKDVFLQKYRSASETSSPAQPRGVQGAESKGVRLEKDQLLSVLHQASQNLSGAKIETSVALHQQFKSLAQQLLLGKDQAPQLKTYPSLERAVEAANAHNRGAELIVAIKNDDGTPAYAVIELKPGAKAAEVAAAAAELGPQAEAYLTREDGVIRPIKSEASSVQGQYERAKSLSDMAIADNARGFDVNRTGTQEAHRTPAYRANLAMVKEELNETQEAIQRETLTLRRQLDGLLSQGEAKTSAVQEIQVRLEQLQVQQETLQTADTLITTRLLQLPVSKDVIPGSAQRFGEYRNHPEKIQQQLHARIAQIDSRLMVAQDPGLRTALESQKQSLLKESVSVSKRHQQHQVAALNTRVRIGALATINKSLDRTHQRLAQQVKQLSTLEDRLPHLKGPELLKTQAQIQHLRQNINQDRKALIKEMEKEIGVYRQHANGKRQGAKDALDLLENQVEKLKSLEPGQEQLVLTTVDETRELLLASVKAAGDKFIRDTVKPRLFTARIYPQRGTSKV